MYVCICNQITETRLREEINRGATTVPQLRRELGVTRQCGKCEDCVQACINKYVNANLPAETLLSPACNA